MRPGSMTAPPWGAIASPQIVIVNEDARGGAAASSRAIQRATCRSGREAGEGEARMQGAAGRLVEMIHTLHVCC